MIGWVECDTADRGGALTGRAAQDIFGFRLHARRGILT